MAAVRVAAGLAGAERTGRQCCDAHAAAHHGCEYPATPYNLQPTRRRVFSQQQFVHVLRCNRVHFVPVGRPLPAGAGAFAAR